MSATSVRCIWPATARLGESPLWSTREAALYWVDILGCKLMRHSPENGDQRSWQFDEYLGAVAERKSGGLILTMRSGFAFFDPVTETLTHLHNPEPDRRSNRFNDGKVDALGRLWAGSMDIRCSEPSGSLYRFDPDLSCVRVEDGYAVSNGPAWSSDGRTMYHTDTVQGRVYAYDFDPRSGAVSDRRLFASIDPSDGYPDGMTPDSDGGLWVAHYGGGKVIRYMPNGRADMSIALPVRNVTSCSFGGQGFGTLYITTAADGLSEEQRANEPLAGGLFACEPQGLHGMPAFRFAG